MLKQIQRFRSDLFGFRDPVQHKQSISQAGKSAAQAKSFAECAMEGCRSPIDAKRMTALDARNELLEENET